MAWWGLSQPEGKVYVDSVESVACWVQGTQDDSVCLESRWHKGLWWELLWERSSRCSELIRKPSKFFSQSVTWYRSKFCNDCFCCCGENVLEGKGNACGETSWDGSVKASWEKNGVWNGRPAVERHAYSEPDLAWQWLNWALGLVFMGWGFCRRQEEIIFWGNLRSRGDRYDQ